MTTNKTRALNGNKSFGGTGNGALYAAITSAPATTMEWRPEMERDVKDDQPVWRFGMEDEIVVSQFDGRLNPMDGDHDKLVDDILKIFDDVVNNRDTDNGELGFAERIASRINDMMKSACLTSFAQAAIMMVAERESKTKNKDLWSEVGERLAEEGERKDRQSNLLSDFVMDARRDRQQQAQQQKIDQDNYNRTYSNDELDQMEWSGDANDVWNIGDIFVSRRNAYDAGKRARDEWMNSPSARAMTPEERARIEEQWSRYLQAIKNNDPAAARAAYDALPPDARALADKNNNALAEGLQSTARTNAHLNQSTRASAVNRAQVLDSIIESESPIDETDIRLTSVDATPIKSVAEEYGFEDSVPATSSSSQVNLMSDFKLASVQHIEISPQSAQVRPQLDQNFGFG